MHNFNPTAETLLITTVQVLKSMCSNAKTVNWQILVCEGFSFKEVPDNLKIRANKFEGNVA